MFLEAADMTMAYPLHQQKADAGHTLLALPKTSCHSINLAPTSRGSIKSLHLGSTNRPLGKIDFLASLKTRKLQLHHTATKSDFFD